MADDTDNTGLEPCKYCASTRAPKFFGDHCIICRDCGHFFFADDRKMAIAFWNEPLPPPRAADDIVERLRADADKWMAGEMDRDNEESGLLSHEAATEITRLRIALAAERERCAALVENWNGTTRDGDTNHIAEAIRNSGDLTYSLHVTAGVGTGGGGSPEEDAPNGR